MDDGSVHRNCIDTKKGNCKYVTFNQYNVAMCSIDKIIQVEHFACRPAEAKKLRAERMKGE